MRDVYINASVYRRGALERLDMAVAGGLIDSLDDAMVIKERDQVFDLSGFVIIPGFVDVHVHLREPGFSYKETIASGTRAAARGGYTAICAMPNLDPAPDSLKHLKVQLDLIERDALVEVLPYGCLTMGRKGRGQPVDFSALAPYVAAFSDDGTGVQDEETMEACMRGVKAQGSILAAHCEDERLVNGGYIHDGDYARAHGHRGISSESEWRHLARDLKLVEKTGCRYHMCHVSTKESVRLIRSAKAMGLDITCETAPHYLTLSDDRLMEDGRFKMNPPIRSLEDRDQLIEGILDGTIDMIATDHAPHSPEEKARGLEQSAMGVVGLETAFPILNEYLVESGILTLEELFRLMCDAPRARFGIAGGIEVGGRADFAVLDTRSVYALNPNEFASMGRATPFSGMAARGKCLLTAIGARRVYDGFSN